jgi:hypothetical protein
VKLERRKFGFWYTIRQMSVGDLVGVEGLCAAGAATGLAYLAFRNSNTDVTSRVGIVGDFLSITSALIGVVFAGFALVIALMSDRYLLLLERNPEGTRAFLAPFMVSIGVQISTVLGAVAYRASAARSSRLLEHGWFIALVFLFIYAALNIVALARSVLAHGATRAEQATMDELQRQVDEARSTQEELRRRDR